MKDFYNDTYCKSVECSVLKVFKAQDHTEVLTDKTICYPECGGQPGDRGTLGPYPILDTKKAENGDSIHYLPKDCDIAEGQILTMTLDWPHRYKFMVMHTAQHMLSGLLFNNYDIGTVSVHLGDEYLTIETNRDSIEPETIKNLVLTANDKISEAHKIVYHEMSHSDAEALGMRRSIKVEGDVRIVEIEGVDRIACGGVHAACTSELRLIIYLGQQKIRDQVRLFFVCGEDAQEHVYNNKALLDILQNKLGCSTYGEIEPKVEKLNQQLDSLKQKYKVLCEKSSYSEIKENLCNDIACFDTDIELDAILKATENFEDLALCAENDGHWLIVLKGRFSGIGADTVREKILTPSGAKGGGRNGVYQGLCSTSLKDLFSKSVH